MTSQCKLLVGCFALVLLASPAGHDAHGADATSTSHVLRSARTSGTVDLVEIVLEAGGDLNYTRDGKVQREKMNVVARFAYHERSVEAPRDPTRPWRSIRHYGKATGTVKSGGFAYEPNLRSDRRLIGVEIVGREATLYSPQGPLTWEELQLIDVQGNSLLLDRLLPDVPVAVGGSWKLSDDRIAALLGLDTVAENTVESTLKQVADGKAQVELSGRVEGTARGAAATIELLGKYRFDLDAKRIGWAGLLIKEKRSEGHVDAGFDVVARIQVRITPGRTSGHLTDAALAGVATEASEELTRLEYESEGGAWRLLHDRRWHVRSQGAGRASLRLVDRGDKLAHCNVTSLPPSADATKSTLEDFQNDVKQALGEHFRQFVRASQWHSDTDYRVFCLVAAGQSSDLPFQWIYYQVIDQQGRRVVFAFVVQEEHLPRLEETDRELVDTLLLTSDPASEVASKPSGTTARP